MEIWIMRVMGLLYVVSLLAMLHELVQNGGWSVLLLYSPAILVVGGVYVNAREPRLKR